ncbi:MAG: hypothetical protein B7Z37_01940 [Verrucomicrobia bacterium 12-59-8]|nr:MAG: hypothetical protein B7Z37_01940 [Verrucomicrobia bacterium 12-59-8]
MTKNKSYPPSHQKKSFDGKTKSQIDSLKRQVTDASNKKDIAQTVVLALTSRQTAAQGLLARAQTSSASAEQTFHDAQVVTQTVINGYGHAVWAQQRAGSIRDAVRELYEKSYAAAVKAVLASQAVEDFALGVKSYQGKNEYFPSDVTADMPAVLLQAQTALTASLQAVQACMLALAGAEEAVLASDTVVREAMLLLDHLLPHAAKQVKELVSKNLQDNTPPEPVTNLREYALYQADPPSLDQLAAHLDKASSKGLLYLLDAIRQVRDFTRDEMNDINSEVGMELNAAKHVLDKADKLYTSLQASLIAVSAAV